MRIFTIATLLCLGISSSAFALNDYPVYIQKYKKAFHDNVNREDHKIRFGYHPYYFSNTARSRHSYSAFEKGHYRYGTADKPWPFPKNKFKLQRDFTDPTRILKTADTAKNQRKLQAYIEDRMKKAKAKPVESKVGDSRELESIIEQHKWEYESKELMEAFERDSNAVRTDKTDYLKLFEQN